MTMPVCVMPEPPVYIDWPKDVVDLRALMLMGIVVALHNEGDECAKNQNHKKKKPFNPVLATYVWEGWQD